MANLDKPATRSAKPTSAVRHWLAVVVCQRLFSRLWGGPGIKASNRFGRGSGSRRTLAVLSRRPGRRHDGFILCVWGKGLEWRQVGGQAFFDGRRTWFLLVVPRVRVDYEWSGVIGALCWRYGCL